MLTCAPDVELRRGWLLDGRAPGCTRFRSDGFRSDGFPGDGFDLCLFSDVLYYLSARETDVVLAQAAQKTKAGGVLLIANEWSGRAGGLTPPQYAFERLDANADWERFGTSKHPLGETELSIAIYRRVPDLAPASKQSASQIKPAELAADQTID